MGSDGADILEVELPRGWVMTLGRRAGVVGFRAVYTASCGGVLLMTLEGGELAYEARGLRAVDEAVVAARTLLEELPRAPRGTRPLTA